MKNEIGFINKRYIQPDYYTKFFSNWAAVYLIGNDEYHIQSVSDPYDIANENIVGFEVLRQGIRGQSYVRDCGKVYSSITMVVKIIESFKRREDEQNMKKYIMAEASENNTYVITMTDEKGNKLTLNGAYSDFKEADRAAKEKAQSNKVEYVCNS